MNAQIRIGILFGLFTTVWAAEPARAQDAKVQVQVQVRGGAYITGVYNGWPATRARTERGVPVSLEKGDIIVACDGMPVRTEEDLGVALQVNGGEARLEVINCRTRRLLSVYVRPVTDRDGVRKIGVDAKTVSLPLGPAYAPAK